ncbi:glycosyltransferase [Flavobacterium sp. 245]|uniref:glycosyltransferase n=1 Tax=Flavobacterium sp. 245 TaxID=2512115 RepID=UPI0010602AF8|nr:glycosyltransferase [Flavobacterium sp. 245]TDP00879.1 putative rhamnosyltransferase [Flavobacterium sp. 245]
MKQFIVTRFNLKKSDWKNSKSGNSVLTNEWLEHRFSLFENYCFPSVINQSNQNFIWCIFFDIDTPEDFKNKIIALTANRQNIIPIFIDGMDALYSSFKKFISENITVEDSHIITTRIDNDDIVHQDFIEVIQSLFQPSDLTVIDLREGYQVSIDVPKPEVRLYTHPFNAFISVIESTKSFETVFSRAHYDWKTEKNVISYKRKRLWMELSHQENYVNHRRISLKKAYHYDSLKFCLPKTFEINILDTLQTNLKIDINEIIHYWKKKIRFVGKLPFRGKRYFLKKINYLNK